MYWMLIVSVIRSLRCIYQLIIGWSVSAHCSLNKITTPKCFSCVQGVPLYEGIAVELDNNFMKGSDILYRYKRVLF